MMKNSKLKFGEYMQNIGKFVLKSSFMDSPIYAEYAGFFQASASQQWRSVVIHPFRQT